MEGEKHRKLRQQVVEVKFLASKNVIELTFDEGLGLGCKSEGHVNMRFPKLYILPCSKSLQCSYFKNIFDNKPSLDDEIEVSTKQQYFINACHKLCLNCINNQGGTHIKCNECKEGSIYDLSYSYDFMKMCLCTSLKIHNLKEFHEIYKRFESHIMVKNRENMKKKRSTPFMILQCEFISKGFAKSEVLRQFGIKENMVVMISFSNVPNEIKNKRDKKRKGIQEDSQPSPFWEDDTYSKVWKEYYSSDLIKTQCRPLLVLNGRIILEGNILELNNITFDMVLMIYHPRLWNDFSYKTIVNQVNHYYLTSPFKGKQNQTNPRSGQYPSICHGYSAHRGQSSKRNVVMYSKSTLGSEIQMSYRAMGDNIASSIWKHLPRFGSSVQEFFQKQFFPINCIPIGLEGYETEAHQIHISKNSYIRLHIDPSDMEASFITWFVKGAPKGGALAVFQHCLKFDNDKGAGIWIRSENLTHGTLPFDSTSLNDFKLGVAIGNKVWLHTRLQNQLKEGTPLTFQNNEWYIEDFDKK